ncbi:MAG: hypothetical protein VKK04_03000 [Synechococcales bacterium]|nr:hypothetical protein [Synechococcales bacterium]
MTVIDNPRQIARDAIQASISEDLWLQNARFIQGLKHKVQQHPVSSHPAIQALNQGRFNREQLRHIHLEYRHAIVQVFTDALLIAQYQSRQLEPRLTPGSKMYARFLLTLNTLDEFGFQPGADASGYYRGNPNRAHYPLFERVLDELGISAQERCTYRPSQIAQEVRTHLEDSFNDFSLVTSLLAVAEEEVVLFSAPLRENSRKVGVTVTSGYYLCHGTSDDAQADANDDAHEDDLWYVLMQALLPDQYETILQVCSRYCDLWVEFWDAQMQLLERAEPVPAIAAS